MDDFIAELKKYYPLKNEIISLLKESLTVKVVSKNDILLHKDRISTELYWIKKGTLRGYIETETNLVTTWFAIEQDMVHP